MQRISNQEIWIINETVGHSLGFHFLISHLKSTRNFEFRNVFVFKSLVQSTMLTQYHYKHYELDLQKIVKCALDYNGNCLFENFVSNFVHFSSRCIYIVMVDRDRINVMQKFFKILKCIVIYYPETTFM